MATPGRGGPHTCSSAVSGGPKHRPCGFICGQRASGVDALCAMHCAMLHHHCGGKLGGAVAAGMGTHLAPARRGNRQEMHGHLAGSLNSWPHRSAMWQEERTTMWCVCVCDNKISRSFSCSPVAWQLPGSLSAVRLAIACCFIFLQSVWPQPTSSSRFFVTLHCSPLLCHIALL